MKRTTLKKTGSLITVFLLLIVFLTTSARAGSGYFWDFENGGNPGFSKAGHCSYTVTDKAAFSGTHSFLIFDREGADANVSIRPATLGIRSGNTARVSFLARQDSAVSGMIRLSYTGEGGALLAEASLTPGQWVTVEAEFLYDCRANLLVSTDEALTGVDLMLDDLSCEILSDGKPVSGGDWGKWPSDLPSLREAYADHFLFGSALAGTEINDFGRRQFCIAQFSILTPGNELKPDSVFDTAASRKLVEETGDETQVAVTLKSVKYFLDYCQASGIAVHGHTLLWHNQTPAVFFRRGYSLNGEMADREIMLGRMENYIKAVMEITEENYPGLIVSWDVLNEAIDDGTGKLRTQVPWYQTVGPDYPEKAFEFARKYARPDVILCYNDYSIPNPAKLNGILELLAPLVQAGTVDCCGFQAHYQNDWPSAAMVDSAMTKVAALGLKLRVSEMDIKVSAKTDAQFQLQARRYGEMMKVFLKHERDILAVQLWGVTDDTSWLASQYPLPFSAYGQPKPAFQAILDAVK